MLCFSCRPFGPLPCRAVQVYYVLNTAPDGWDGGVGFITPDIIKSRIAAPGEATSHAHVVAQPLSLLGIQSA